MALTNYYGVCSDLRHIDWEIMRETYWHDTPDDNDRKRRRMAEFLVRHCLPRDLIIGIGVYSGVYAAKVSKVLREYDVSIPVKVKRDWYY